VRIKGVKRDGVKSGRWGKVKGKMVFLFVLAIRSWENRRCNVSGIERSGERGQLNESKISSDSDEQRQFELTEEGCTAQ
jgi:hypothetical protein